MRVTAKRKRAGQTAAYAPAHPGRAPGTVPAAAFRGADRVSGMRLARGARTAILIDACCVLVFVVIGRASHVKGESLAGIASTAWPFLCGLAAGWIAARAWRRPLAIRPAGIVIWLCTVALGMILRVVSGQGTAAAFIVVALAFLGLFLLGWRLLGRLGASRFLLLSLHPADRRKIVDVRVHRGVPKRPPSSARIIPAMRPRWRARGHGLPGPAGHPRRSRPLRWRSRRARNC